MARKSQELRTAAMRATGRYLPVRPPAAIFRSLFMPVHLLGPNGPNRYARGSVGSQQSRGDAFADASSRSQSAVRRNFRGLGRLMRVNMPPTPPIFREMLAKERGFPGELGKGDLCRCKANCHRLTPGETCWWPANLERDVTYRLRHPQSACEGLLLCKRCTRTLCEKPEAG